MKILNFEDFMKKYNLKNDTMEDSEIQRVYKHPIYVRGSRLCSDIGSVNLDNGSQGGIHWCCFSIKDNQS